MQKQCNAMDNLSSKYAKTMENLLLRYAKTMDKKRASIKLVSGLEPLHRGSNMIFCGNFRFPKIN